MEVGEFLGLEHQQLPEGRRKEGPGGSRVWGRGIRDLELWVSEFKNRV